MLASSSGRVPEHTALDVNMKIRERYHRCVEYFRAHPSEIPERLKELDREWDIERALAALSSTFSLVGLALGRSRGDRRMLAIPAVVQGFYLQHTLQGWCPPLPILRRLGFRTATEIEREKCALKDILRLRDPNTATSDRSPVGEERAERAEGGGIRQAATELSDGDGALVGQLR